MLCHLKLNIRYFVKGQLSRRTIEVYNNLPFNLSFENDTVAFNLSKSFIVNIDSDSTFKIKDIKAESVRKGFFGQDFEMSFGNILLTPNVDFFERYKGVDITVSISPMDHVVANVKRIGAVREHLHPEPVPVARRRERLTRRTD